MFFSTVAITAFAALAAAAPVKRGFGGRATYYATGLGACGEVSSDSDFIVALNTPQFGGGYPGPNCFKQIQISANGKTAMATIMDQCPGCGYGDLDMSPSLFNHFADPAVGVFQMSWDFAGGAAPAPEPKSTYVAPTTSSTPEPTPTSTYVAPTSTWVAPTTTSVAPSSTWVAPSSSSAPAEVKIESTSSAQPSSSSASSSVAPTTTASGSAVAKSASVSATSTSSAAVPTITVDLASGNLAELCDAVAQMGKLVVVGASLANGTAVNVTNGTALTFANGTAVAVANGTAITVANATLSFE
ncbi:hypothetical protein QFC19_004132 [Naganishia cerealis]|uniref:Uncharacterized protein n=1 Tax=Naganishia cerealis TaxID=610337 RepID=A0ACC2VYK0_9TREE|nr:hypothetical protein QFC19_004132 [Naganishia cerealis]